MIISSCSLAWEEIRAAPLTFFTSAPRARITQQRTEYSALAADKAHNKSGGQRVQGEGATRTAEPVVERPSPPPCTSHELIISKVLRHRCVQLRDLCLTLALSLPIGSVVSWHKKLLLPPRGVVVLQLGEPRAGAARRKPLCSPDEQPDLPLKAVLLRARGERGKTTEASLNLSFS